MKILAEIPGFGRIYECRECPSIHMQVGPVNMAFEKRAYFQLVALVNASASEYELLFSQREEQASKEGDS